MYMFPKLTTYLQAKLDISRPSGTGLVFLSVGQ